MSKQRHIIARTVLELDIQQIADVWSLQSDVSRLFQQQGAVAIAELFDQLVGDEEVVRLDRVEVDIGSIDSRFLADEFIQKLLIALRETLGDTPLALSSAYRLTEHLLNSSATKPETISRDGSDWQVLLHFLRYGRLPWWCPVRDWQEWLPRWLAAIQNNTNWQHDLRELLINNPAAQQRLVEQLPEGFRHQLVLHLQPTWVNWHSLLTEAKQLIQTLGLNRGAVRYLEQQAWLLLFGEIARENAPNRGFPSNWTHNWLAQLVSIWRQSGSRGAGSRLALSAVEGEQGNFPENLYQIANSRLRAILAAIPDGEQSVWLTALDEALTSIADITPQNTENIVTTPSETSQEQEETQIRTPQTDGEILLYFLQYGRFPGKQLSTNWQEWLSRWLFTVENNTDWQLPLWQLLRTNPEARQRLVTQLPEDLRHQLLLQLQPGWENWRNLLTQARFIMQSLSISGDTPTESFQERFQELETLAWELLLVEISSDRLSQNPLPAETWISTWLTQLIQNWLGGYEEQGRREQGSREQGSREQGAGEQGAGSREQGNFPENLYQIANSRLRAILAAIPDGEQSVWLTALDEALTSIADITQQNPENIVTTPSEPSQEQEETQIRTPQTDGEILLYFLQYGRFPGKQLSTNWQEWLSLWSLIVQNDTSWQLSLRQLLRDNPEARQRLVTQFPEDLRHQLLLQLQPGWGNWRNLLIQATELMQGLGISDNICEELIQQAWFLLLAEIPPEIAPETPLPATTWTCNWLIQLVQTFLEEPFAGETGEQEPGSRLALSAVEGGEEEISHLLSLQPASDVAAYQYLRSIITTLPIAEVFPWLAALEQVLNNTSAQTSKNTIPPSLNSQVNPIIISANNSILSTAEETAGLYISQAGLVLLHPFIRSYLEAVGLLNNELFRDESAQQTAIYLLYYLATKQTDAPEYELVLPKLLCGWSLNQPLARGLDLPVPALEEGERLLQTVINYWQVLKSTSPDGLREGFLQRQGKLTRSGDGNWKLQVEQQAIDILLGSLPWGVSMVTLPWMEGLLMVEWV
ncbi:contractile injection system tape measure protein [Calothrix sp. 336/3]|uniref:contractile injection system tape measure protein n=1 Tax=Calothrix sp. 336/3 TaxID=1337936 RepID=UPI0004E3C8AD|nr:contractile injection system tape measure protein [Calothrix sp. 336/3]